MLHIVQNFVEWQLQYKTRIECDYFIAHKMVCNEYIKLRILRWHQQEICPPTMTKYLASEGIKVSWKGVAKFIKRFCRIGRLTCVNPWLVAIFIVQGTIARQAGSGRRTVIMEVTQKNRCIVMTRPLPVSCTSSLPAWDIPLISKSFFTARHHCGGHLGGAYCQLMCDFNKQETGLCQGALKQQLCQCDLHQWVQRATKESQMALLLRVRRVTKE